MEKAHFYFIKEQYFIDFSDILKIEKELLAKMNN